MTKPTPYVARRGYISRRRHPIADIASILVFSAILLAGAWFALVIAGAGHQLHQVVVVALTGLLAFLSGNNLQAALWRWVRRNDPPDPEPEEH